MIKALTSPLLNGSANKDVITPQTVKNTTSVTATLTPRALKSILTALKRSYSAPKISPSTIEHKKYVVWSATDSVLI